ncbi:MAG: hypothetical protein CL728_04730 [Chloroflexi bacterium]|nr:hypothetical protein [Chloroflexota bacterium]|tara:strand:+ start:575 stop:1579 length:1005 start_codon:yes stop_codon:yes gene_type:complete
MSNSNSDDINEEDLEQMFQQMVAQNQAPKNVKKKKNLDIDPRAFVGPDEMIFAPDFAKDGEVTYAPELKISMKNVIQLVVNIQNHLNPNSAGETSWDLFYNRVVVKYLLLRKHIFVLKGKAAKEHDALKGSNMAIITTILLYCIYLQNNTYIPVPMFVSEVNKCIKRNKTYSAFTLTQYEQYRTNDKYLIKSFILENMPQAFDMNLPAQSYIIKPLNTFFGLKQFYYLKTHLKSHIQACQIIAKEIQTLQEKEEFSNDYSPSQIAIGCLFIGSIYISISTNTKYPYSPDDFGIPKTRLLGIYTKVLNATKKLPDVDFPKPNDIFKKKSTFHIKK